MGLPVVRNSGNSALARRRRARDPMAVYDRLPPEVRAWLAQAALPWSPDSALRCWRAALGRTRGCPEAALREMDAREAGRLAAERKRAGTALSAGRGS